MVEVKDCIQCRRMIEAREVSVTIDGQTFKKVGDHEYGSRRCANCAWNGSLCLIVGELESICGDGHFVEVTEDGKVEERKGYSRHNERQRGMPKRP